MTNKIVIICICSLLACVAGQRITTIQLDGVQYFISRMNPYSPELNYFLAYQYCRSLGLQLASFETKEKVESMTQYLTNAGYSKYDFWTSGNRLGTGMFLWMSTGLPFNATFDFFENTVDAVRTGLLDPEDHNSNTAPQRTARDSSSGLEKACVMLKAPTLKWMPEDCSVVKDFICEQTRCYYYNYGSIPVSSAQGRPIITTTTTTKGPIFTTTTLSPIFSSTFATLPKKPSSLSSSSSSIPSRTASLRFAGTSSSPSSLPTEVENKLYDIPSPTNIQNHQDEKSHSNENISSESRENNEDDDIDEIIEHEDNDTSRDFHETEVNENSDIHSNIANNEDHFDDIARDNEHDEQQQSHTNEESHNDENKSIVLETNDNLSPVSSSSSSLPQATSEIVSSVEERLKRISQEIEKLGATAQNNGNLGSVSGNGGAGSAASSIGISSSIDDGDSTHHQSFLSLSDLIKTLRPSDKKVPQIDSDYSNTMRVLGETSSFSASNSDETRKLRQIHNVKRSIF